MKRLKRTITSSVDLDNIPEENKNGNCFKEAFDQFMKSPSRYTLVHGVVTGQGPLDGLEYCHAWVLDGNTVIDNTLPINLRRLPKSFYYDLGNIRITREYDLQDVYEMIDRFETYGPWDEVFDAYP